MFNHAILPYRRVVCCLLATALLAACTASPSTAPAVPRPPAVTATPGVDLPDVPDGLYVLERGQIARISADGRSRNVLTAEAAAAGGLPAISSFDVLHDGSLVYTADDTAGTRLMLLEPGATAARQLFSTADVLLSSPLWQPDGSAVLVYLSDRTEVQRYPSGIYRIDRTDGGLQPLLNDPTQREGIVLPPETVRPVLFNPQGSLLLIHELDDNRGSCRPALLRADGGLIRPTAAADVQFYCGEERWTADGAAVLLSAGAVDNPGIQRLNADGSLEPLTPPGVAGRAAYQRADGTLAFTAVRTQSDGSAQLQPAELAPDGTLRYLNTPSAEAPLYLLWTEDGSGILTLVIAETGGELRFVRVTDGAYRVIPQSNNGVSQLRWLPSAR